MADGRPLVSVVTVCYNSERHIAEAIESVLAQTYPKIEYVIVDGGSTDATLGIVRSYEPRFEGRLIWFSEKDEGIYDAMNKGIVAAGGELIGLLNSDDAYLPDAVEVIVEAAEANPLAGAVYGDAQIIDEAGGDLRIERSMNPLDIGRRPAHMPMCHQSLFVRRDVYERLGGYDLRYRILADYEFVLRSLRAGVQFARIDRPIARFRTGGTCSSDMSASNREREAIRVRYGANPIVERAKRFRHGFNNFVHGALFGRGRPNDA